MVIALLVLLGVNLIVIVGFVAFVVGRRRWIKRQPGAYVGAIRVTSGNVEGLSPKWKRGYGRWVRDVLVWTNAPLFLSNDLVPVDSIAGERSASGNEVKRLGDELAVIEFESDKDRIEVAASAEYRALVAGGMVR